MNTILHTIYIYTSMIGPRPTVHLHNKINIKNPVIYVKCYTRWAPDKFMLNLSVVHVAVVIATPPSSYSKTKNFCSRIWPQDEHANFIQIRCLPHAGIAIDHTCTPGNNSSTHLRRRASDETAQNKSTRNCASKFSSSSSSDQIPASKAVTVMAFVSRHCSSHNVLYV
jgi:hypothetical protein